MSTFTEWSRRKSEGRRNGRKVADILLCLRSKYKFTSLQKCSSMGSTVKQTSLIGNSF